MTITILQGDVVEQLKTLEDCSIQCVVTSPPYFGLRDYGIDGQIGMEETPELFVAKIVEVFREVKRVLRDDGTLWLNFGDSYAGPGWGWQKEGGSSIKREWVEDYNGRPPGYISSRQDNGLKPKDLIGIPWMVAFALRTDGWYLRSDIIWSKPNPMPESVTDRPTKAHEYVFLLTKSARYYYDADAIREPHVTQEDRPDRIIRNRLFAYNSKKNKIHPKNLNRVEGTHNMHKAREMARHGTNIPGHSGNYNANGECILNPAGRNRRTVWEIATQPTNDSSGTARLTRAKCLDEVSYGMMHIVSPSCPVHGGLFDSVASEFCGGRAGSWKNHIEHTDDCPVLTPNDDSVLPLQNHKSEVCHHNSGCPPIGNSSIATPHNKQKSKRDRDPLTASPCKPYVEMISHTHDKSKLLSLFVQQLNIHGNNILPDEIDARLQGQIPCRNVDNVSLPITNTCMCAFFNKTNQQTTHFATFPEALVEPCIKAGSKIGDVILDPFGGSGTTAKVARDLKRDCILIELNPAYVKIMKNKLRLNEQLVIE